MHVSDVPQHYRGPFIHDNSQWNTHRRHPHAPVTSLGDRPFLVHKSVRVRIRMRVQRGRRTAFGGICSHAARGARQQQESQPSSAQAQRSHVFGKRSLTGIGVLASSQKNKNRAAWKAKALCLRGVPRRTPPLAPLPLLSLPCLGGCLAQPPPALARTLEAVAKLPPLER